MFTSLLSSLLVKNSLYILYISPRLTLYRRFRRLYLLLLLIYRGIKLGRDLG